MAPWIPADLVPRTATKWETGALLDLPAEIIADNPLFYLRLGEAAGTLADDSSGNNRPGTHSGAVTPGVTGLLSGETNKAADYAGGKTSIASAAWMDTAQISAFAIIEMDSVPSNGFSYTLLCRHLQETNGSKSWQVAVWNDSGTIRPFLHCYNAAGTAVVSVTTTGTTPGSALVAGHRYRIHATYDGTTARLYVDGVQVATQTVTHTMYSSGQPITIGAHAGSGVYDRPFDGRIDEVAVFGTGLSAARVLAQYKASLSLYQREIMADGEALYLRMGETSGNHVDSSGNNRDFTNSGGAGTRNATGLVDKDYDGAMAITSPSFSMHAYRTHESWMNPSGAFHMGVSINPVTKTGSGSAGDWYMIARKASSWMFALQRIGGSGEDYHVYFDWAKAAGGSGSIVGSKVITVTSGIKHQIHVDYDGTTMRLYVDGVLDGSAATTAVNFTPGTFTIGTYDQSNYTFPFLGTIDEFYFGLTSLTTQRITARYTASNGVYTAPVVGGSLSRSASETLTISDGAVRTIVASRSASESVSLTEAPARVLVLGRSAADSVPLTEAATQITTKIRSAAESLSAPADTPARALSTSRSATDSTSTTDAATRTLGFARGTTESIPDPFDATARSIGISRSAVESTSTTDLAVRSVTAFRVALDSLATPVDEAESINAVSVYATDTVPEPTDAAVRSVHLLRGALDGLIPVVDDALRSITVTRGGTETLTVSDTAVRDLLLLRTATEDLTDVIAEATQWRLVVRYAEDTLPEPGDAPFGVVTQSLLPKALHVTLTSVTDKVGPDGEVVVEFTFDQIVSGWTIRLGSTGPYDGVELAASDESTDHGTATIPGAALVPGENELALYGRSPGNGGWA